jgi:excisionase family DNA binding protein
MTTFVVENVSVPAEVEQAIDKRSSMAAVGNLNDYVKYQMGAGMEKGAGAGGIAAEMAVGMAMAQQMANQAGGVLGQSTPGIANPAWGAGGGNGGAPPAGTGASAPASAAAQGSGSSAPVGATSAGAPLPDLYDPAQVAHMLGVAESDVLASLESGDLKGRRIGTQWRITRAAVDTFLHG